ncbi:MAG: DMT family transporter [Microbacterium sp.]
MIAARGRRGRRVARRRPPAVAKGDVSMLLGLRLGAGELFMLAAVVTWTVYTIAGRRARLPVVTASAVQAVLTTVVLTPAALVVGVHAPPDPALWADVAYVVLFPSVLAFTLWNLGVRGVGAARAGVTLNLIPVFTAVIGLAVGLGIDRWQLIGGSVVIAGCSCRPFLDDTRRPEWPSGRCARGGRASRVGDEGRPRCPVRAPRTREGHRPGSAGNRRVRARTVRRRGPRAPAR